MHQRFFVFKMAFNNSLLRPVCSLTSTLKDASGAPARTRQIICGVLFKDFLVRDQDGCFVAAIVSVCFRFEFEGFPVFRCSPPTVNWRKLTERNIYIYAIRKSILPLNEKLSHQTSTGKHLLVAKGGNPCLGSRGLGWYCTQPIGVFTWNTLVFFFLGGGILQCEMMAFTENYIVGWMFEEIFCMEYRLRVAKYVSILKLYSGYWDMGVSKNRGTPQIIHFNRVFHYFHHPFGG